MAKWLRNLRLQPEWDQADEHEITVAHLAGVVADRLEALAPFDDVYLDEEKAEIVDDFRDMSTDETADFEDFNGAMHRLYDWADTQVAGQFFDAQKVCWVDMFTRPEPETASHQQSREEGP